MIITTNGRPLGNFPDWKFRRGDQYLLKLVRVDVSDARHPAADPFYRPFIEFIRGSVLTVIFRTDEWRLILFFAPRKITYQFTRNDERIEL